MNIFRRLWILLHPKDDVLLKGVRAFSEPDIAELRDFRNSDGFEVFTRALDIAVNIYAETLLSSRDAAALHEARGVILGLRKAALLVDETLQAHARLSDAERDSAGRDAAVADGRRASLFGTPSWHREL